MPRAEKQKLKILYVAKFFLEYSDEDHAVSVSDIIDHLQEEHGISASRQSIYRDIPIIHSSREAISVLKWLTYEAKNTENRSKRPQLFIIFDDYSELSEFSEYIIDQLINLLRLARHAKFHFWLVTSTPSASFLPSDLKDNRVFLQQIVIVKPPKEYA